MDVESLKNVVVTQRRQGSRAIDLPGVDGHSVSHRHLNSAAASRVESRAFMVVQTKPLAAIALEPFATRSEEEATGIWNRGNRTQATRFAIWQRMQPGLVHQPSPPPQASLWPCPSMTPNCELPKVAIPTLAAGPFEHPPPPSPSSNPSPLPSPRTATTTLHCISADASSPRPVEKAVRPTNSRNEPAPSTNTIPASRSSSSSSSSPSSSSPSSSSSSSSSSSFSIRGPTTIYQLQHTPAAMAPGPCAPAPSWTALARNCNQGLAHVITGTRFAKAPVLAPAAACSPLPQRAPTSVADAAPGWAAGRMVVPGNGANIARVAANNRFGNRTARAAAPTPPPPPARPTLRGVATMLQVLTGAPTPPLCNIPDYRRASYTVLSEEHASENYPGTSEPQRRIQKVELAVTHHQPPLGREVRRTVHFTVCRKACMLNVSNAAFRRAEASVSAASAAASPVLESPTDRAGRLHRLPSVQILDPLYRELAATFAAHERFASVHGADQMPASMNEIIAWDVEEVPGLPGCFRVVTYSAWAANGSLRSFLASCGNGVVVACMQLKKQELLEQLRTAGVLFGDLKDENIVVDEQLNLKLIDLDGAKLVPRDTMGSPLAQEFPYMQTYYFSAPEMLLDIAWKKFYEYGGDVKKFVEWAEIFAPALAALLRQQDDLPSGQRRKSVRQVLQAVSKGESFMSMASHVFMFGSSLSWLISDTLWGAVAGRPLCEMDAALRAEEEAARDADLQLLSALVLVAQECMKPLIEQRPSLEWVGQQLREIIRRRLGEGESLASMIE